MEKLNFYIVNNEYVSYLKEAEIKKRGFSRVPNMAYDKKWYKILSKNKSPSAVFTLPSSNLQVTLNGSVVLRIKSPRKFFKKLEKHIDVT